MLSLPDPRSERSGIDNAFQCPLRVIDHHRSKKQGWPCEPLQTHQKISVNSSSFSRRSLGQMNPRLGLEIEMMINSENAKHL